MTPRKKLLEHLQKPRGDEECDHGLAEKLLMVWLRSCDDAELADAWKRAQDEQNWWYA